MESHEENTESDDDEEELKNMKKIDELFKVETLLNRDDDSLPFAYFNPETDGKLTWVCGPDSQGKITSVFCYDRGTHKEKQCAYIDTEDDARNMRKILIENGWQKLKPPKIKFRSGTTDIDSLNRKQKRFLNRKLKQLKKKNPFDGNVDESKK